MMGDEQDWLSITDAFYGAAIDSNGWLVALEGLAAGTGSRAGELIGLGSANTVPFNWVTDLGPDWHEEFIAVGGGDPAVNPFVRHGTRIAPLEVVSSAEFVTREERRSNDFLADFTIRHDIPHICLTPLIKESGTLIGLAVMRSRRQGEIDARQRALFSAVAPHVRAAARMQMALEHQGASLMANALEALSLTVFICDRLGKVKAMTPSAEALASSGDALRLQQGLLKASIPAETKALQDALRLVAGGLPGPGQPVTATIPVRGKRALPLVLELFPLPRREFAFGFEPRVLVVVRGAQSDSGRMRGVLALVYGLTSAETDVAVALAEGQSPEAIAAARHTSLGTVRVQIRTLYTKLGVRRQSELVARLNQLR